MTLEAAGVELIAPMEDALDYDPVITDPEPDSIRAHSMRDYDPSRRLNIK